MQYCNLSSEQLKIAAKILNEQGFNQQQINAMLFNFQAYDEEDARKLIREDKKINDFFYRNFPPSDNPHYTTKMRYSNILKKASLKNVVPEVLSLLRKNKIYLGEAWAIHLYSANNFEPVLKLKRDDIDLHSLIRFEKEVCLKSILRNPHFNAKDQQKISKAFDFVVSLILHPNSHERLLAYLVQNELDNYFNEFRDFLYAIREYDDNIGMVKKLDRVLKRKIQNNVILYRGVDNSFARSILDPAFEKEETNRKVEEKGFVSSSLTFGSSLCSLTGNVAIKLFVPKGTEGLNIMDISNVRQECEILLNTCDLFLLDQSVETFLNDDPAYEKNSDRNRGSAVENIRRKVYTALVLSKNRECYKSVAENENDDENN